MDETIPMQVKWVESILGGTEGMGHVHINPLYYPDNGDMVVNGKVDDRASYGLVN